MTDHGKAQIQALGAGLVGFVVVVGAGAAFMLHRGGSPIKAPVSSYAPVDAVSALAAPAAAVKSNGAGTPMGETASVASSPAPLLPASERAADSEAAASAAPAAAPAAPSHAAEAPSFSRKLVVTQHLDGTASATSSAKAVVAAAPAKAHPAKKPFLAPKLDLSKTQSALASSVHYGVSNRAELMGRAAGPVYNFSGKKAPQQFPQGPSAAGAMQQVDDAQRQIDNSPLDDSDKAALKANLGQVRQAVETTSAAQGK